MRKMRLRMPKNYDLPMHLAMLVLLLFGSIMIVSTSVGSAGSATAVIKTIVKQCGFIVITYLCMTFFARNFTKYVCKEVRVKENNVQNRQFKKFYRFMFYGTGVAILGLLALTLLFPGVNGSKAWIPLGIMSLQPSEFAKIYSIVLIGVVVNDYGSQEVNTWTYVRYPLAFYLISLLIIALQPDLGTLLILTLMTGTVLLIPSNKALDPWKIFICVCLGLFFAALIFISTDFGVSIIEQFNVDYKLARVVNAQDPFKDLFGSGYNLVYSLYAIATGGVKGLGLGGSKQKFGYLPEAQTDFIISVTIEELGLFGFSIIVICYTVIILRLLKYALKSKSEGFKVILIGCVLYLSMHFILNVGGASALIPLTGVPLLFISSGGSSLLSIMILLGICQSIIALTKGQMERLETKKKNP